ncbi:MAG: CoA transferase [Dehalococcoidia bacterium]|nr:CoA transferase [Dehalococcoidia bacterium]
MRILDLTRHLAGAGSTRILGILGAEVLRFEWPHPPALDFLRLSGPNADGVPGMNRSGFFAQTNVHKKSVALDLSTPRGQEILRKFVPLCDIVVESFTPGVMKKWGLDYAGLRALREDVIYVAASGFGHTGPLRDYRSVGPTAQAYSGLTAMVGLEGCEPAGWGFSYMDHMGATMNAAAMLMALERRRVTGKGEFIDGGQSQHGAALLGPMLLDATINGGTIAPRGNRDLYGDYAPANAYRCAGTDRWVTIAVRSERDWLALCRALGLDDLAARPELRTLVGRRAAADEIDAAIAGWTSGRDRYQVMDVLQAAGVAAGVVQHVDDKAERDPALAARQFYTAIDDDILGRKRYEGVPLTSEEFDSSITTPSPWMGEHTREVLTTVLGFSDAEVDELAAAAVIWEADVKREGRTS